MDSPIDSENAPVNHDGTADYNASDIQKLEGLDQALAFIRTQHELPRDLYRAPKAFIVPNEFSPKQKDTVRMSLWARNGLHPLFSTKTEVQKA